MAINRKRTAKSTLPRSILVALFLLSLAVALSYGNGYRLNLSPSMPEGIWQLQSLSGPLQRGQVVIACPENTSLFQLARARGYLGYGQCRGQYEPLLKPVIAVAGDTIDLSPAGVMVNGKKLPHSAILTRDSQNRLLPYLAARRYSVHTDEVWLVSTHIPHSFDSRYFGSMPLSLVQGLARPVWIWH